MADIMIQIFSVSFWTILGPKNAILGSKGSFEVKHLIAAKSMILDILLQIRAAIWLKTLLTDFVPFGVPNVHFRIKKGFLK